MQRLDTWRSEEAANQRKKTRLDEFWINPPTGLANLPTGSCETRREKRFWSKPAGMVHKPIDRFFQQVQTCWNMFKPVQQVLETHRQVHAVNSVLQPADFNHSIGGQDSTNWRNGFSNQVRNASNQTFRAPIQRVGLLFNLPQLGACPKPFKLFA